VIHTSSFIFGLLFLDCWLSAQLHRIEPLQTADLTESLSQQGTGVCEHFARMSTERPKEILGEHSTEDFSFELMPSVSQLKLSRPSQAA
jgi:hypothetical protein